MFFSFSFSFFILFPTKNRRRTWVVLRLCDTGVSSLGRNNKVATHVLVFMRRGIYSSWKQIFVIYQHVVPVTLRSCIVGWTLSLFSIFYVMPPAMLWHIWCAVKTERPTVNRAQLQGGRSHQVSTTAELRSVEKEALTYWGQLHLCIEITFGFSNSTIQTVSAKSAKQVTAWQIVFHQIVAISNNFREMIHDNAMTHLETHVHHELSGSKGVQLHKYTILLFDFVKDVVINAPDIKLHNIVTRQIRWSPYNQTCFLNNSLCPWDEADHWPGCWGGRVPEHSQRQVQNLQ